MPHKLVIAMGLGKPKGDSSAPPSYKSSPPDDTTLDPTDPADTPPDPMAGGGTITPDEVDYSDNDLCETCSNMGADRNCTKYNFPVDKTGHCEAGYEPKGGDMSMNDLGGLGGGDASQIPPAV